MRAMLIRPTVLVVALLTSVVCGSSAPDQPSGTPAPGALTLAWSDEFDGADGSRPDPSRWMHDLGGGGWGNDELQTYTDRPENAVIRDGSLIITARAEHHVGDDGIAREYTSARLKTLGRFEQAYGRIEARMRLPRGQGLWPAFWMLGADIGAVGWPACGEIDIMEHIGREPLTVYGTLHGPGYSGAGGIGASVSSADGRPFAAAFHVFSVEWEPDQIRWYVDGQRYQTRRPSDLPAGSRWVFDHPHFVLVNLAVGGSWPGPPDDTTEFPQELQVDWVRAYAGE
jgi:beta-glucanase (GH16 family)